MLTIIRAKWLGNLGVKTRGRRMIKGRTCMASQVTFEPTCASGFTKRRNTIIISRPEIATNSMFLSIFKTDFDLENTQNIFGWPTDRTFIFVNHYRSLNQNRIIGHSID